MFIIAKGVRPGKLDRPDLPLLCWKIRIRYHSKGGYFMDVFVYGGSDSLDWWGESLPDLPTMHFVNSSKELLSALEKPGEKLVFLDFDYEAKKTVGLDKEISSKKEVIRIVFSDDVKVLKKYQKSKNAAHGYMKKPLTQEVVEEVVRDFSPSGKDDSHQKALEDQSYDDLSQTVTSIITIPDSSKEALLGELTDDIEPLDKAQLELKVDAEPELQVDEEAVESDQTIIIDESTGEFKIGSDNEEVPSDEGKRERQDCCG